MTISLGSRLLGTSNDLPGPQTRRTTSSVLFGLSPGGVCRVPTSPPGPVRSYRTISPLPRARRGGVLSVALSLSPGPESPGDGGRYPPPCPVEVGLSSTPGEPNAAVIRPTGVNTIISLLLVTVTYFFRRFALKVGQECPTSCNSRRRRLLIIRAFVIESSFVIPPRLDPRGLGAATA